MQGGYAGWVRYVIYDGVVRDAMRMCLGDCVVLHSTLAKQWARGAFKNYICTCIDSYKSEKHAHSPLFAYIRGELNSFHRCIVHEIPNHSTIGERAHLIFNNIVAQSAAAAAYA